MCRSDHVLRKLRAAPLILLLLMAGCSTSLTLRNPLFERLKNRGAVELSADNPFLASNLALSKESERSAELRGFIEHRGAPNSIEVKQDTFRAPILFLYYSDRQERYVLEEVGGIYAIRGPEKTASTSPAAPRAMTSPPRLLAGQKPKYENEFKGTERLATSRPAGPAEKTPKGDLVHHVTFPGETLVLIARWYTGRVENAAHIARSNKLSRDEALTPGDIVVVSSDLVTNDNRLTEGGLSALKTLQREGG